MMELKKPEHPEQNLRQSPKALADIIATSMDAIIAVDDAQRIVLFNAAAQKMFRCPADEAMGSSVERFIPQRFRAGHSTRVRQFDQSGVTNRNLRSLGTLWGLRATGEEFPIEASISKVESAGKKVFTAVIRDITERKQFEEAVRKSEERFRSIADAAPVLIWMSGTDKLCTYFNKPWLDFTGRSIEQELGNGWAEGVHPDDLEKCLQTYTQSFDRREQFRMEYRLRRHDGGYRWILDIGVPRFNKDRSFLGYIGIGVDVTDRKLASEREKRTLEMLDLVTEQMAAAVTRCSRDFQYVWANQGYADWLRRPLSEIVGHAILDVLGKEAFEHLRHHFERVLKGQNVQYEEEVNFRGIGKRWISATYTPTLDADGRTDGWVAVVLDITERKLAEETLRKSEERFRLAAQAGKMYSFEWDVTTDRVVRSSEHVEVLAVKEPLHTTHQQFMNKVHPDDRPKLIAAIAGLSPENPTCNVSYRVLVNDGAMVWIRSNGRAFFDGEGKMLRLVGMVADITDQKLAEEALRVSEERLRSAQWAARIGTFEWNIRTGESTRTPELEALYGVPPGSFGKTHEAFVNRVHPDDRVRVMKLIERSLEAEQPTEGEWQVVWPDGSVHWIAARWRMLMDESGKPSRVVGVNMDVTERKRAEEALHESEERFRLAAQAGRMYAYTWDVTTDVIVRSGNASGVFGSTGEAPLTRQQTLVRVHPDDLAIFNASVSQHTPEHPDVQISYRMLLFDGSVVWVEKTAHATFDEQGRMVRVVGMVADITERKKAEEALSAMTRKLVEAQEQERARIARELHDDIGQRLAMLTIDLDQVQQISSDLPPEVLSRMVELRQQTKQISAGVQSLSHDLHSSQLEHLGVVTGIKSWCREFGERRHIQIDFEHNVQGSFPPEIGLCLFRVLQEALHNAAKHSGVKRFEVQLHEESGEIHLIVSDSGRGFDVEAMKQGRGLGLTSMRERVRLVNGTISIESNPMSGTTIHVRIPLESEYAAKREAV
jgi:PAS domain S-box-containing protein